jgi:hypothetical protein
MKLRDYQVPLVQKAVDILRHHRFIYLALETRTGKTPVSLMAAAEIAQDMGVTEILFCTKLSVIPGIKETYEALKLDYPILQNITVSIVSFDSLHKVQKAKRVIIADEAHGFGAYPKPSKRAVQLRGLSAGCPVIMLSATPTPESFSQMYHQLWAANSSCGLIFGFKNFYAWARVYVNITQKRINAGQSVNDYSDARKDLILPLVQPMMLTFTKKEAGFVQTEDDIDERIEYVEMPLQIAQYVHGIKKDRVIYHGDKVITARSAATLMAKVHQLCSGTVIHDESDEGIVLSRHKLAAIGQLRLQYPKIAIFYKYIAEGKMLKEHFGAEATSDYKIFRAFRHTVFIGQFISKREGIDLKEADAIICINIDFAYLSYIQMVNRMMNYTRTKKPVLVWVFSKGGIEDQILKVVKSKHNYTTTYFQGRKKA